ncbi:MAG: MATE family efflux transporter [Clostridium sp.]|nr:MATE family efflux transporter [Clostridium sp.]
MNYIDFTDGSIKKSVLKYFFPLLFSNILQQFYSFVDMVMIGKGIDDIAVAAVGNFMSLSFLVTGFITGLTNGFSVNISHEYGRKNFSDLKKYIASSIKMCVYIAIGFSIIGVLLLKPMLILMKTDIILIDSCLEYGYVIFCGLIVSTFYNLSSAVLRVLGDSKTPLIAVSAASVINIILDLFTIYILKLGVLGPAVATVFAQFISTAVCFIRLKKYKQLRLCRADFAANRTIAAGLLKNGFPMALMNSITSIGTIFVQSCVNHFGVIYTTAYSAGNKYLNLLMLPGITLGFTASAFTGQNYGVKKYDRIRTGVKISLIIGTISVLIISPLLLLFPSQFANLIITETDAVNYTSIYLRILSVSIILLNFLFIFRSSVQGLGKSIIPMLSGILEMMLRMAFIFWGLPAFGFAATIYAEIIAWTGALILNFLAYKYYVRKL